MTDFEGFFPERLVLAARRSAAAAQSEPQSQTAARSRNSAVALWLPVWSASLVCILSPVLGRSHGRGFHGDAAHGHLAALFRGYGLEACLFLLAGFALGMIAVGIYRGLRLQKRFTAE